MEATSFRCNHIHMRCGAVSRTYSCHSRTRFTSIKHLLNMLSRWVFFLNQPIYRNRHETFNRQRQDINKMRRECVSSKLKACGKCARQTQNCVHNNEQKNNIMLVSKWWWRQLSLLIFEIVLNTTINQHIWCLSLPNMRFLGPTDS